MKYIIRALLISTLLLSSAWLGVVSLFGEALPQNASALEARYEPVLKAMPAMELPAKSASLVAAAAPAQKEAVALAVMKVVSKFNPSAMPTVVGAISRVEPSLSAKLSGEAAKLQPKLREDIQLASVSTTTGGTLFGATPTKPPIPVEPPVPSPGRGKHKGHYKNP